MERPNCFRCLEYLSEASYAPCATPTLKAAMKILMGSGVASQMTAYLPSEVRGLINTGGASIPGTGIKIPFGKKKP